jgi:hypothetical protein
VAAAEEVVAAVAVEAPRQAVKAVRLPRAVAVVAPRRVLPAAAEVRQPVVELRPLVVGRRQLPVRPRSLWWP